MRAVGAQAPYQCSYNLIMHPPLIEGMAIGKMVTVEAKNKGVDYSIGTKGLDFGLKKDAAMEI